MKTKKVVLDTNLWISFLITDRLTDLDDLLIRRKVRLIFSKELIEEFLTVSKRPKFEKYFSESDIRELLGLFDKYGKLIDVSISLDACRDIKDNFLLNIAAESNADYLVTGDKDLLILKNVKNTRIVTWVEFIKEVK
ncbi:MAG: putative toxin-antitoxin system toxin component, PIN family [Cyclobacteriaceae bacterium]|nr:putative toxin-antitoxin system toxin component, PIN family [Cyclobacteriaceae bacterium]